MPTGEELKGGFTLGEWEIIPDEGVIRCGETEVKPEPQTWRVLLALAKRDGTLVTRQDLVDEVWGGRAVADEPITRSIREVRRALSDSAQNPKYVETLHKRGYRLLQPVVLHAPQTIENVVTDPVPPGQRSWKMLAAALAAGFVGIIAYLWWVSVHAPVAIAVMPFENLGGNNEDDYLVSGFKEELILTLASIDNVKVKNARVSYPDDEETTIIRRLGVDLLLFGKVRRIGDNLKVSYLVSGGNEGVVHSGDIEGAIKNVFAMQESLALKVRDDLVGKSVQVLIKSRPSDSDAYDSYMRGAYALEHRGDPGSLERAIELLSNAIDLDPNYGPSYLALATVYTLMPTYRGAPVEEMDARAIEIIAAGIAADPAIEDAAGAIYGHVYKNQKRWADAEEAYLRAVNASAVDSNAFNWYSRMLASVGRLDESLRQILAAAEIDPTSPVVNSRTAMSYAWLLDQENALMYYERANELGWRGPIHTLGYAFILIQTGQIDRAEELANGAVEMAGGPEGWVGPVFAAFRDPGKSPAAIAALNEVTAEQTIDPVIELTARTLLGDLDGAMRIAELLEQPGEAFEMDMLFIPELAALRGHPDFLPLLERLGVTAYWSAKGCTWNGDRVICPSD